MLKFEAVANIGDVIKAWDFEPVDTEFKDRYPDRFLIGKVVEKGMLKFENGSDAFKAFTVEIIKSSLNQYEVGQKISVPFETSMDWDGRVELVAEAA